jgi:NADH:ubiquinone oxidoreductase subunit 3 (subunit A)
MKIEQYSFEYGAFFIYVILCVIISIIILVASYFLALQRADFEKLSAYECGFAPFEDTRTQFDVKFYLVGILFIVFDLEIVYIFPWIFALNQDIFSFWSMMFFLIILGIAFIYEWIKGSLDW